MLATTAGVAAYAGCLWAASPVGRQHERGQGPTPAPTQPDWPERSRAGRLPWGRGIRGLARPRGPVMHAGA